MKTARERAEALYGQLALVMKCKKTLEQDVLLLIEQYFINAIDAALEHAAEIAINIDNDKNSFDKQAGRVGIEQAILSARTSSKKEPS